MKEKFEAVGVDISKDKLDVCFVLGHSKRIFKSYPNNLKGVESFVSELGSNKTIPIVMESTGRFHLAPYIRLLNGEYSVYLINPILTKQYADSRVRKCKTDKIDSEILAKIGLNEKDSLKKQSFNIDAAYMKRKIHLIEKLKKVLQIQVLMLKDYDKTITLLGKPEDNFLVDLRAKVKDLQKTIEKEQELITKQVISTPLLEQLDSIAGISRIHAIKILCHLANKKFSNRDQLVAFAGLDVSTKLSGSSIHGKGRLSKRGDPILRKILFQSAWGMVMHSEEYKGMYDKYKGLGKHYCTCLIIIARKLLRELYKLIRANNYSIDFFL